MQQLARPKATTTVTAKQAYQNIVKPCVFTDDGTVPIKYPHCVFFDISNRHLPIGSFSSAGTLPINDYLKPESSATDNPSIPDAYLVWRILISKRLPVEVAVKVMYFMNHNAKEDSRSQMTHFILETRKIWSNT